MRRLLRPFPQAYIATYLQPVGRTPLAKGGEAPRVRWGLAFFPQLRSTERRALRLSNAGRSQKQAAPAAAS